MTTQTARQISMVVISDVTSRRFVTLGNNGTIALSGAGADSIGVAAETSDLSGGRDTVPVALLDGAVLEVEAGAAIDVSSSIIQVASDANGRAVTKTTGDAVLGWAKTSAGAAGEFIEIVASKSADLSL